MPYKLLLVHIFFNQIASILATAKCTPDPIFEKFLEIRRSQISSEALNEVINQGILGANNTTIDVLRGLNDTVKETIQNLKRTDEIWAGITEVIIRF